MTSSNFTTTLLVGQSPEEVFNAVNDVHGWWSKEIEGDTKKLNDEFTFEVKDVHYSKQKLVEVIPNKKVVWLVTESNMTFIKDKDEWTGTKISFDISKKRLEIQLIFTYEGLVPGIECYNASPPDWIQYIQHSLFNLITTGKGAPNLDGRRIEEIKP